MYCTLCMTVQSVYSECQFIPTLPGRCPVRLAFKTTADAEPDFPQETFLIGQTRDQDGFVSDSHRPCAEGNHTEVLCDDQCDHNIPREAGVPRDPRDGQQHHLWKGLHRPQQRC